MSIVMSSFGQTPDGKKVDMYTVVNKNGMTAKLITYGAILQSLLVPDRDGKFEDVVHGFDTLEPYFVNEPNFGATIGRHANRIGGAAFDLNGAHYELDKNDGRNNLHGGYNGYHKRVWSAVATETTEGQTVMFTYQSPDGDQGFPGNVTISVSYTLTEDNALVIAYKAVTDKDTIMNLTNHTYFNLAGHGNGLITSQKAWIDADSFTFADEESIPNGEIRSVKGTPMDFTVMKEIGDGIDADYDQTKWGGGFDHNWVLKTKKGVISKVAAMQDDASGRYMEVYTDLPGIQFYTGNFLTGELTGKGGVKYAKRSACCFETQYFPNAINVPSFDQPVLKAGDVYETKTIYKFLTV